MRRLWLDYLDGLGSGLEENLSSAAWTESMIDR